MDGLTKILASATGLTMLGAVAATPVEAGSEDKVAKVRIQLTETYKPGKGSSSDGLRSDGRHYPLFVHGDGLLALQQAMGVNDYNSLAAKCARSVDGPMDNIPLANKVKYAGPLADKIGNAIDQYVMGSNGLNVEANHAARVDKGVVQLQYAKVRLVAQCGR